jgi:hypothetical protein
VARGTKLLKEMNVADRSVPAPPFRPDPPPRGPVREFGR